MNQKHKRAASIAAVLMTVTALAVWFARAPAVPVKSASQVSQPEGWDDDLALAVALDINPDPDVIEIELEARIEELEILPGTSTAVWTYNGSLPGPLIRARVGDRLIVHFTNSLPEATTIHWHGLRVPNDMDGAPGFTQMPIEPGDYFRYEFELRDAGTFWYHPHQNSAAQVGRGLYGPIVVEDPDDPAVFGDDLVLVLSDISLEDGQLQSERSGGGFGDLFGREGSIVLVNGRVRPTLRVRAGKQQRWRVINAARTRYFRLATRGAPFVRLGGDHGLAARSETLDRFLIVPGERADLVYTPADAPGDTYVMRWVPVNRGWGTQTGRVPKDLLEIVTVRDRPVRPDPIPELLRDDIEPLDIGNAVEHTLDMSIMRAGSTTRMGFNNVHHDDARPLTARIGETHVWTIVNDTDFAHPFHLHGYFFQVLDDERIPEWKDTVDVPARSQLRVAMHFDERPGMWMYHCHILDHAEVGMMGHLLVTDPEQGGAAPAETHHPAVHGHH